MLPRTENMRKVLDAVAAAPVLSDGWTTREIAYSTGLAYQSVRYLLRELEAIGAVVPSTCYEVCEEKRGRRVLRRLVRWSITPGFDASAPLPRRKRKLTVGRVNREVVELIAASGGTVTSKQLAYSLFATTAVRAMLDTDTVLRTEAMQWAKSTLRRMERAGWIVRDEERKHHESAIWRLKKSDLDDNR